MDRRDVIAGGEHVDALLGAYSLGILDDAGVDRVDRHIDHCAACREELSVLQDVAASLSFAAPYVQPPSGLKNRVLARVAAESHDTPCSQPVPFSLAPAPPATLAGRRDMPRLSRGRRLWPILAVAAALVVALLGGDTIAMQHQINQQQHVVAALEQSLQSQMDNQKRLIASLQGVVSASTTTAKNASATIHMLHGMGPAVNSMGTLVMSPGMPVAVLIVHNMPTAQVGMAYDCWLISRNGARTFVGTVVVNNVGDGYMPVVAPHALGTYQTIGVTSHSTTKQRLLQGAVDVPID